MGATAVVSGCGECGGFGVGATASSGSVCRFADFPGFRLLGFLVFQLSRFPTSWLLGFPTFQVSDFLVYWFLGMPTFRLFDLLECWRMVCAVGGGRWW